MSFFTKPEITKDSVKPINAQKSFIDILYNHVDYLQNNNGKIAKSITENTITVAIVGAGPAGLIAAYQLMMIGINVEIFEAQASRPGGRIFSYHPVKGNAALFEMGAMRVPPSEQLFNYYAEEFGMVSGTFPDPGKVDTKIIYDGILYDWPAHGNPPEIFNTVANSWKKFVASLQPIADLLISGRNQDYKEAIQKWQNLIFPCNTSGTQTGFSNISFYQGLTQLFVIDYKKYSLKKPWGEDEFALFAALGLGSGGFGSLYPVNFSEIVRLVINGLETDQQFYAGGLNALTDGFGNSDFGNGSVYSKVKYDKKVIRIIGGSSSSSATVCVENEPEKDFDAVIVATTNRAMQIDMGITLPVFPYPPIFDSEINSGIRQLHLMNSSKLFVLTKTKFWNSNVQSFPQNIQTDGLVRGLYCLDYEQSEFGVVLISYTWGDDSTKYIAVKDANKRLDLLLKSLQNFIPEFVNVLKEQIISTHTSLIDWQDQLHYYGAFKLNYPGQDAYNQNVYYQFTQSQNKIFLAGDSISWSGGWIEGALQTGMNAATAVVNYYYKSNLFNKNPMEQIKQSKQYTYS